MPTEIFEDGLDLHIGLLEAETIAAGPAYPLPRLRPVGDAETRTFRTVLLENAYVRVTVIPALGGRILSLFDKRTGTEILRPSNALVPQPGGPRGVRLSEGLQLRLDGDDRPNALGNVAVQIEDPQDDESPGGVWIAETAFAPGLSFHLLISLPPDRAEVRLEARILNRTLAPLPYNGELAVDLGPGTWDGRAFYSQNRDAGLALFADGTPFDGARLEGGILRFARFGRLRQIAPRQVDTWTVTLVPYSRLGSLTGASREAAAYLGDDAVRVQTASARPGHKLLLLTEGGQTLEAPADLYPEHVLEIPLEGLPDKPRALVLADPRRDEVLRVSRVAEPVADDEDADLRRATFEAGTRHIAYTALGIRALRRGDWPAADLAFEQALMFNADDPLLWWDKALARRLATTGEEEETDRPELLNAHYLAPLEPALRAEAFLAQPMTMGKEPNPLLAPLEENPEEFVEVACLLIERGRLDQASRWIDEALRHRDLAILRLLMAYCLLQGTRLDAEAAEHLAAASRVAGAPYPWRPVERVALQALHQRFPQDAHVAHLLGLLP
jgi:tetratricopeptide (TPR) repeat protein